MSPAEEDRRAGTSPVRQEVEWRLPGPGGRVQWCRVMGWVLKVGRPCCCPMRPRLARLEGLFAGDPAHLRPGLPRPRSSLPAMGWAPGCD